VFWGTSATYVVGLDVGTTKVCTLIARLLPETVGSAGASPSQGWETVSFASVRSRGVQRATVVDLEEAASAVAESLDRAEQTGGVEIQSVWVGITGHHIRAHPVTVTLTLPDEETDITTEHLEELHRRAQKPYLRDDQCVLHLLPRQFIINGVGGIRRPLGLTAREIRLQGLIVTADASFVRSLTACVRKAGVEVAGMVLEPLAAGEAVLTESEKELGTVVMDIGGGTTDVAVFLEGALVDTFALPVGGNHVTRDLAIGLRTPLEEAERLKIRYGSALPQKVGDEAVEVLELGQGKPRPVAKRALAEIIEARMRELFELAAERLQRGGWTSLLAGGIVLTGGGSLLEGVAELAQEIFNLPVRIGEPMLSPGSPHELRNPMYATLIGLVLHALRHHQKVAESTPLWRRWLHRCWQRVKNLWR